MNDDEERPAETSHPEKLPFKRLEFGLNRIVGTAIPLHVRQLKEGVQEGRQGQIAAAKTVHLLKADLRELEQLNALVREEDADAFHARVRGPARDVIEALSEFMEAHSDVLQPFPESDDELESQPIPALVCHPGEEAPFPEEAPPSVQVQHTKSFNVRSRWLSLKRDLFEIDTLVKRFSALVFAQQPSIDSIQDNVLQAQENVHEGTRHLGRAVLLSGAALPLTGALIGGAILGPVGALVGLKLLGSVACAAGGGILGYGAGRTLKQHRKHSCELEMKALTYSRSSSDPSLNSDRLH